MVDKIKLDSQLKNAVTELTKGIKEFNRSVTYGFDPIALRQQLHNMEFYLEEISDNLEYYRDEIAVRKTVCKSVEE